MSVPLLITKLHKPTVRTDWVERPNLLQKMNDGLDSKLILVSAPAGFGKSSLISAWIEQIELPFAWFSIDEQDNDPILFLSYLVAAIQGITPSFGNSFFPALQAPQPPDISSFLSYFVNALVDMEEMILILDDFHLIKNDSLFTFVDSLIKYAPENFHVVISTRSDPPIQLTYWRAKQFMVEIRTNDLRFSLSDTSKLIEEKSGAKLDDDLISVLNQRTEGWITGLQMALLSLRHVDDKAMYIHQFSSSNRYILDYLLEEVLSRQPEEVRIFLLKTACLSKLCASICNYVTGYSNAQEILEQLESENLFTISLDDQRRYYRYHHLFSDLLQHQSSSLADIDQKSVYLKASQWYEENQEHNLAVEFAFLAGDIERALAILDIPGMYALTVFGLLSLEKYLDQIPYERVKEYPNLLLGYAWVYLATSRVELVEECLAAIESKYRLQAKDVENNLSQDVPTRCLFAELQIIRGNVNIHQSNFESVLDLCQESNQYLDEDVKEYSLAQYEILWSLLNFNFALAYEYIGELALAEENFLACIELSRKYQNSHLIPVATSHLAQTQKARGHLSASKNTYNEAIQYMESSELPASPLAGIAYVGLGHLFYQMDKLEEAEQLFIKGLELAQLWNHWESIYSAIYGLACVFSAKKLWEKLDEQLERLCERINEIDSPWGKQRVFAQAAKFSIQRGDTFRIQEWVNHFELFLNEAVIYSHVYELLIYARANIELQSYDVGNQTIDLLCKQCEENQWIEYHIQCLMIRSILFARLNSMDSSKISLKNALMLGKKEGYKRLFLDEYAAIKETLGALSTDEEVGKFVSELISTVQADGKEKSDIKARLLDPDSLSEREVEVLEKIAAGLSNQQAALSLHIAEGTIKNHLKNIFSKLNATSRTQAIMIAREKGYLHR